MKQDYFEVVDLAQGTDEWLAWRIGGVTAYMLYCLKKGIRLPDDLSKNPHVRRGKDMEPKVRTAIQAALAETLGDALLPICAQIKDVPFIRASLDGISKNGEPVEMKAPSQGVWDSVNNEGEKSEHYATYWPQVQHQMLVTGSSKGHLVFGFQEKEQPTLTLKHFVIERDDEYLQGVISASRRFMENLALDRAPALDPAYDVLVPDAESMQTWIHTAQAIKTAEAQIKSLKDQIKTLEEAKKFDAKVLVGLKGEFAIGEAGGVRVSTFYTQGAVDYKVVVDEICEKNGIDLDDEILERNRRPGREGMRISVSDSELPKNNVNEEEKIRVVKAQENASTSYYF